MNGGGQTSKTNWSDGFLISSPNLGLGECCPLIVRLEGNCGHLLSWISNSRKRSRRVFILNDIKDKCKKMDVEFSHTFEGANDVANLLNK